MDIIFSPKQKKYQTKIKFTNPDLHYDIFLTQQSQKNKSTYYCPIVDISKKFKQSNEIGRKKEKITIKAIEKTTISKDLSNNIFDSYQKNVFRSRFLSEGETNYKNNRRASELVDQLLFDIYGRTDQRFDTDLSSTTSYTDKFDEKLQLSRIKSKDNTELRILIAALTERVNYSGTLLVKQLKKKDSLQSKQNKMCNIITAHLQAFSEKTSLDTAMKFSPNPNAGDSGFNQWRDAMKMVAKLPGGIPPEFRKKLWLALAEKHLQSKKVNWAQTEKICFNEWSNPDDSELGIQIVKDLHRTGCSLFCGAAGQENQVLLKRVLLAYARWNKNVGYCQGFNMLAALILQVMDKNETDSVKVMIYLIEGVLPESYFANNLRGLSVDMIVFRDLLKLRLPLLSKHLEALQNDAREGNSYEPPLTNVFTMQWFLTLFCNCLPQSTVLRVWDLIFLEGNEILLRTAIAIWEKLSDRILAVNSADEFYSIMGVLTREMLEFGLVDSNTLIKSIVAIGTCNELNDMRDKYLYNITPWTQSVQSAAKKGFKLFYSDDDDTESDYDEKAAVTAAYGISIGRKKDKTLNKEGTSLQPYTHHPDRERLALDISALKKQYAKLRERQRQAHIILQAACARQPIGQSNSPSPIAMNHLLLGKNAIVNSRGRRLGPPKGSIPPARIKEPTKKKVQDKPCETIHWKDTEQYKRRQSYTEETLASEETFEADTDSSSYSDEDQSSTSTELCDEPGRLSDFDIEEKSCETKIEEVKKEEKSELISDFSDYQPNTVSALNITNFSAIDNLNLEEKFEDTNTNLIKFDSIEPNSSTTTNEDKKCSLEDKQFYSSFEENTTFISSNLNEETPTNDTICFASYSKDDNSILSSSKENINTMKEEILTPLNEDTSNLLCFKDFKNEDVLTPTNKEDTLILTEDDKIFDSYFQGRESQKEDNPSSPKEEQKLELRRHKSYEEHSKKTPEKSKITKQQSFDVNILPIIETSLWKPYKIEEESPKEEIDQQKTDLLTVEDKRLELGRRNSERALKIIQENSLILHRILQQQKSSEVEDSDDELSRSPISKTFLRSESLLSKDERTDEDRSSRDGEEDLESGYSISPALLEEIDSKTDETLTSKNEDISNFVSSIDRKTTEEYSPIVSEEKTSYDVASSILDYSKIEDISSTSNDIKFVDTIEEYTFSSYNNTDSQLEDIDSNYTEYKFDDYTMKYNLNDYEDKLDTSSSSVLKPDFDFNSSTIEEEKSKTITDFEDHKSSNYNFDLSCSSNVVKPDFDYNSTTKEEKSKAIIDYEDQSSKYQFELPCSSNLDNPDFDYKSSTTIPEKSKSVIDYEDHESSKYQFDLPCSSNVDKPDFDYKSSTTIPEKSKSVIDYEDHESSKYQFDLPCSSNVDKPDFDYKSSTTIPEKSKSVIDYEDHESSKYQFDLPCSSNVDNPGFGYKSSTTGEEKSKTITDFEDYESSKYRLDLLSSSNVDNYDFDYKSSTIEEEKLKTIPDFEDNESSKYQLDLSCSSNIDKPDFDYNCLTTRKEISKIIIDFEDHKSSKYQFDLPCSSNIDKPDFDYNSFTTREENSRTMIDFEDHESSKYQIDSACSSNVVKPDFDYKSSTTIPEKSKTITDFEDHEYSKYQFDSSCSSNVLKTNFDYNSSTTKEEKSETIIDYEDQDSSKYKFDSACSSNVVKPDFDYKYSSSIEDNIKKYSFSDNNSKYDREKLSINITPLKFEDSPNISPPNLSCLQFTSFKTENPCSSKCKEKISPESHSPVKTTKYLINLPTLSPPRRSVKSPLSPNRTFSPFPVQPTTRQPKELGVKLGIYKDPLKSPSK